MARIQTIASAVLGTATGAFLCKQFYKNAAEVKRSVGGEQADFVTPSEPVHQNRIWPRVLAKTLVPRGSDSSITPAAPSRVSEIMKYGFPGLDNIRAFDDFVVSYDRRNKVPHWVFEHLTREKLKPGEGVNRESCEFQEDPNVHPYFKATNKDYQRSGYDRGHLAAAGNHRWQQKAMDQTFYLTNISPQVYAK